MAPMKLRVRNALGIKKADIDLTGICLVSGINGAGKSSLLEAVACAVRQTPLARGMSTKKAASALLHEGADSGAITLTYGDASAGTQGIVRIVYPAGEVEQSGPPPDLGTSLGIGAARIMGMRPDDRAREIGDRFRTTPQRADLERWFAETPGTTALNSDEMGVLWDDIALNGWDAVLKKVSEHNTRRKGAWEAKTGAKWGAQKAATWCPASLHPEEEYSIEDEQTRLVVLKEALDNMRANQGATEIDMARLRERAADLDRLRENLAQMEHERADLSKQLERIIEARQNLPERPTGNSDPAPVCPHCHQRLALVRDANNYLMIEKAPPGLSPTELAAARKRIAELDGDKAHVENKLSALAHRMTECRLGLRAAEKAQQDLDEMAARPLVDPAAVDEAREAYLAQERRAKAVQAYVEAKAIYRDWLANNALVKALEPSGVRHAVMSRQLDRINALLNEFSVGARFQQVALTEDMDATYGGRPYTLLSKSERWRVDFILAAVLHQEEERASILLIDEFDILHPQARPDVLTLLRSIKATALIGMTAKEPAVVPNLRALKMGASYWMDAGTLNPIN